MIATGPNDLAIETTETPKPSSLFEVGPLSCVPSAISASASSIGTVTPHSVNEIRPLELNVEQFRPVWMR